MLFLLEMRTAIQKSYCKSFIFFFCFFSIIFSFILYKFAYLSIYIQFVFVVFVCVVTIQGVIRNDLILAFIGLAFLRLPIFTYHTPYRLITIWLVQCTLSLSLPNYTIIFFRICFSFCLFICLFCNVLFFFSNSAHNFCMFILFIFVA